MNAPVYVDIDQGIHKGEKSSTKWKTEKATLGFRIYIYDKFWSIFLEH